MTRALVGFDAQAQEAASIRIGLLDLSSEHGIAMSAGLLFFLMGGR
jgi:hypothetical protein